MQLGDMQLQLREYESWEEWDEVARKQAEVMHLTFDDMLPPPLAVVAQLGPRPAS